MKPALTALALVLTLLTLAGCPPDGEVGDPCTASGDGFTRQDSCKTMCLEWAITCPGGTQVVPDVCAGEVCGDGGPCPAGQMCLQVDSFADNSRCVPTSICPAGATAYAPAPPGDPGASSAAALSE